MEPKEVVEFPIAHFAKADHKKFVSLLLKVYDRDKDYLSSLVTKVINDIKNKYGFDQQGIASQIGLSPATFSRLKNVELSKELPVAFTDNLATLLLFYYVKVTFDPTSVTKNYLNLEHRSSLLSPIKPKRSTSIKFVTGQEAYYVCYRWLDTFVDLSILTISSTSDVRYTIFATNGNFQFTQEGEAEFIRDNIFIKTQDYTGNYYTTFIIHVGRSNVDLRSAMNKETSLYYASYCTISAKGFPTSGMVVLQKVDSLSEANTIIKNQKVINESVTSYLNTITDDESDTTIIINPLSNNLSDKVYEYLFNKRISIENLEQKIPQLNNLPFRESNERIKNYSGIYEFTFARDARFQKVVCQILPSGKSLLFDKKSEGKGYRESMGIFRYLSRKDIFFGNFNVVQRSDYSRLHMILNRDSASEGVILKGSFLNIGLSNYPPSSLLYAKKLSNDHTNIKSYLNLIQADIELNDIEITAKRYLRYSVGSLMDESKDIEKFAGNYECYARSSTVPNAVEMFPLKIYEDGAVTLKSRNHNYLGTAKVINSQLSIVITHDNKGKPNARHFLFQVGNRSPRDKDLNVAVGVCTRINRDTDPRSGIEILIPSPKEVDFNNPMFGCLENINSLQTLDEKEFISVSRNQFRVSVLLDFYSKFESRFKYVSEILLNDTYKPFVVKNDLTDNPDSYQAL